jgi:hypothetical protein
MDDKQDKTEPARQRNWGDVPKGDNQYDEEPTWRRGHPRFTGELVGGLIAGIGMGMAMAIEQVWPYPVDLLLIFIGGSMAYYYQLKRDDEQRNPRT